MGTAVPASAQVNARLDPILKEKGDKGLSAAGISPSQAVRALWSIAASLAEKPAELRALLSPSDAATKEPDRELGYSRMTDLLDEGPQLIDAFYESLGIQAPNADDPLSDEELRLLAFAEKRGSFMGWE